MFLGLGAALLGLEERAPRIRSSALGLGEHAPRFMNSAPRIRRMCN